MSLIFFGWNAWGMGHDSALSSPDKGKKVETLHKLCSERAQLCFLSAELSSRGFKSNVCQNKLDSVWEVDKLREALRKDWDWMVP